MANDFYNIIQCSINNSSSKNALFTDVNDFIFSDNKVDRIDAEAFQLNANGRILFERNNFLHISRSALSGTIW